MAMLLRAEQRKEIKVLVLLASRGCTRDGCQLRSTKGRWISTEQAPVSVIANPKSGLPASARRYTAAIRSTFLIFRRRNPGAMSAMRRVSSPA